MAAQGSGGAYEISQRMTALVGWGATTAFSADFVWSQAVETYVTDPAMADKLRSANPQVGVPARVALRVWLLLHRNDQL